MKMNLLSILLSSVIFLTGCGAAPVEPGAETQQEIENQQTEQQQEEPKESEETKEDEKVSQNPIVTIQLENGSVIKAELYPEIAPNTVRNFISLIDKGFYNGVIFHRVIPGFMVQGGDPDGTGMGGPGYQIKGEFSSNGFENNLVHDRGVLSMARSNAKDSAGSQFFIMVESAPHLDGQYASFGKVIDGMAEVDKIVNTPRNSSDRPNTEQKIKSVTVEKFGVDYPEPDKM